MTTNRKLTLLAISQGNGYEPLYSATAVADMLNDAIN
jgi:hypothetical protein